jgi:spoIIIJ-associated protein
VSDAQDADRVTVEGAGETVGEARWAALRALERIAPKIAEDQVEFVVISEGERGLMGVGREPARVMASAPRDVVGAPEARLGDEAQRVAEVVTRIVRSIDGSLQVRVEETPESVVAIVTGDDAALVIGRHGHTIDAIQHLVLAIVRPPGTDLERDVVVDAQGYRARRERRLREVATQAAEQAVSRNQPVALEPMSAAERKVVHTILADSDTVETSSDGREPERYVVVSPRGADPSP